jgi:hypothetical protein
MLTSTRSNSVSNNPATKSIDTSNSLSTTLSPIKTSLSFLETPTNSSTLTHTQTPTSPHESIDTDITNEPNPYQEITDWFARKVLNYPEGSLHGITAFSSSDSLYTSLFIAKQRFYKEHNNPQPVVFASSEGHSSLQPICKMLNLPLFRVASQKNKGMDMNLLKEIIEDEPHVIVVLTMGTSHHQLYDAIDHLYSDVIGKLKHQTTFHVHIDATFGGLVYPFLWKKWLAYPFDSMNVSLHRHLDLPYRCSLFLTTSYYKDDLYKFKKNVCHTNIFMSKVSLTHLIDHHLFGKNMINHHKECLMHLVNKKRYFLDMNKDFAVCYHALSFKIFIKNIPNQLRTRLLQFNVVGYNTRRNNNDSNTYDGFIHINKTISKFMLETITTTLACYSKHFTSMDDFNPEE